MQGVTFEGSNEYTFLESGCNIRTHILCERRAPSSDPARRVYLLFKHYFIEISGREVAHARRGPFG